MHAGFSQNSYGLSLPAQLLGALMWRAACTAPLPPAMHALGECHYVFQSLMPNLWCIWVHYPALVLVTTTQQGRGSWQDDIVGVAHLVKDCFHLTNAGTHVTHHPFIAGGSAHLGVKHVTMLHVDVAYCSVMSLFGAHPPISPETSTLPYLHLHTKILYRDKLHDAHSCKSQACTHSTHLVSSTSPGQQITSGRWHGDGIKAQSTAGTQFHVK